LGDYQALIALRERTKFDAPFFEAMPQLELIAQTGHHVYHVDVPAATNSGVLVGLGLDELSIHPPLVARVKQRVRGLDAGECARVAQEAAELEDGGAVRELLRRRRLGP